MACDVDITAYDQCCCITYDGAQLVTLVFSLSARVEVQIVAVFDPHHLQKSYIQIRSFM